MCFELMNEMSWTWADYEATPLFVRQFCWDFMMRRRRVQNNKPDDRDNGDGRGVTRIRY